MQNSNPVNVKYESLTSNNPSMLYDLLADDFEFFSPAVLKAKINIWASSILWQHMKHS